MSPSATLPANLTPSHKIHKKIESMKQGVQKMCSECASSESDSYTSAEINDYFYSSSKRPREI